ncbi:MAG: hypothetical protein ACK5M8_20330 [Shewanella algae]
MPDYCTLSPDGMLGVEWSMSCMSHDGVYDQAISFRDKLKVLNTITGDVALTLDVWATASLADAPWKTWLIRAYSVGMLVGTSTVGWLFWITSQGPENGSGDH